MNGRRPRVLVVSYDWRKLERDRRERDTQLTRLLGANRLVLGLVALLVNLGTAHPERTVDHSLSWIVVGRAMVALALSPRRRARTDEHVNGPDGHPESVAPEWSCLGVRLRRDRPSW